METRIDRQETAQRYVDILSDAGFKAVFGEQRNSDVLTDLLNVILPPHRKVRKLTYMTTEVPQFSPYSKSVRLDLRCTGNDGTIFIVELQCYHQANFFKRCVLYAAKSYDSGSRKGDSQKYDIPPVYFIGLLTGSMQDLTGTIGNSGQDNNVISEYTFREKSTMSVADETIFLIFVQLNRFRKKLSDCSSLLDKWCYALNHVSCLDSLPEALKAEAFERLFKACEIAKFSPDVRLKYESEMITERDYYNIIETARQEGLATGLKEGKKEGKLEERSRIAKALKEKGIDIGAISAATGLPEKEIAGL